MLQCSRDVDARHRRQVYAVCAGLTALAGHDEFEPSSIRRIFESDSKEKALYRFCFSELVGHLTMTNWRPIASAPKDGRELTVRRFVRGRTVHEGRAIWRPAAADRAEGWMDPVKDEPVPEPTHWKAVGRGHP